MASMARRKAAQRGVVKQLGLKRGASSRGKAREEGVWEGKGSGLPCPAYGRRAEEEGGRGRRPDSDSGLQRVCRRRAASSVRGFAVPSSRASLFCRSAGECHNGGLKFLSVAFEGSLCSFGRTFWVPPFERSRFPCCRRRERVGKCERRRKELAEPSGAETGRAKRRRSGDLKLADPKPAIEVMGQGTNTAYCQTSPLYVEGNESASSALKSLAEEAKLATKDVKAPSNSILTVCKSLLAGGIAGGVSRSAVAPLERLKILLQVQNAYNPKYSGMIQGLRSIWATEGVAGFFKGNGTNCARIIPNSAVKFYSYEQASKSLLWFYRQQTGQEDAELSPLLRLGAGACAGIIAMSATYPMDMVRGRLTVQTADSPYRYKGMVHAFKTIIKEEGPRAVYKGWLPSVIGVVPYVGLNFAVYETLKDWIVKDPSFETADESELGVVTKLLCGAAAGTVGQTVAYPLDVVRRRMQMVGWKDASPVITADGKVKAPAQYTGMIDAFRQTVRNEGFLALYKGLLPNSVKVVPSIALAFVTYEVMRDLLGVEIRISD